MQENGLERTDAHTSVLQCVRTVVVRCISLGERQPIYRDQQKYTRLLLALLSHFSQDPRNPRLTCNPRREKSARQSGSGFSCQKITQDENTGYLALLDLGAKRENGEEEAGPRSPVL